jgi:hypothetical protein
MNEDEQTPSVDSSSKQSMVIVWLGCFISLTGFYWITRPLMLRLQIWWAELLIYSIVPISVTFILLYRSCWHSELSGWARTYYVLALSCVILAVELIFIGIMLCMIVFGVGAFSNGSGPG